MEPAIIHCYASALPARHMRPSCILKCELACHAANISAMDAVTSGMSPETFSAFFCSVDIFSPLGLPIRTARATLFHFGFFMVLTRAVASSSPTPLPTLVICSSPMPVAFAPLAGAANRVSALDAPPVLCFLLLLLKAGSELWRFLVLAGFLASSGPALGSGVGLPAWLATVDAGLVWRGFAGAFFPSASSDLAAETVAFACHAQADKVCPNWILM